MPALIALLLAFSWLGAGARAADIPKVDGDAGPCSVEFTVTDSAGEPIPGAQIQVHVEYGFLGLRELDLEVGTNFDGKARFEGLPEDTQLFFRASKRKLKGVAFYNPETACHAQHAIYLLR